MRTEPGLQTLWHFSVAARIHVIRSNYLVEFGPIFGELEDKHVTLAAMVPYNPVLVARIDDPLFRGSLSPGWDVSADRDGAIISASDWPDLAWRERLDRLQTLLSAIVDQSATERLDWLFSGVSLNRRAAVGARRLWRDTGDVPALQLVRLDVDVRRDDHHGIASSGLAAIVGHEVEALCDDASRHSQAVLVGRMIGHALKFGPITESRILDQNRKSHVARFRDEGYFSPLPSIVIDDDQ
jgi:hypothetical protein